MSSDDPVRVFGRFATLDALSYGRADVILGRGSFTESFALFGYDLADYKILFEEKVTIFAELTKEQPVTWSVTTRSSLHHQLVYPPTESGHLTTWIGVGGSPPSVVRAARAALPLIISIIGGNPARFRPLFDLYQRALDGFGVVRLPITVHSSGFIADNDHESQELIWPHMRETRDRFGAEQGWGPFNTVTLRGTSVPTGRGTSAPPRRSHTRSPPPRRHCASRASR